MFFIYFFYHSVFPSRIPRSAVHFECFIAFGVQALFFFFFFSSFSRDIWAVPLTKQTNASASCRFWSRSSSGTWRRSAAERTDWTPIWLRFWSGWECAPCLCLCALHVQYSVYMKVNCGTIRNLSQVNSKGYKVCGEASSVCGTITINKRKVGIETAWKDLSVKTIFTSVSMFAFHAINVDLVSFSVWGNEQRNGGEQGARRQPPHWAAEAPAGFAECASGEQQHEGLKHSDHLLFRSAPLTIEIQLQHLQCK